MDDDQTYVARVTLPLRHRDFDTLGHLNQSVYHVLLEEARLGFLQEVLGTTPRVVLGRVELDYRHEVRIADRELTVETAVERVGRSSIRLASRMRTPSGVLAAEGVTVLVGWDAEARGARPLSDAERAALTAVQAAAAADPAG